MGARKELTEIEKRFIVKSLAVYETPSDVMASVKDKFKVTISRAGIQNYDPTKVAGEDLKDELKTLFFETRKVFEENELLPLSRKNDRIRKLSRYVENAENFGNDVAAAAYIEQIAKEEGGMFTNKREISGAGGGPVQVVPVSLDQWQATVAKRREEAAKTEELYENS